MEISRNMVVLALVCGMLLLLLFVPMAVQGQAELYDFGDAPDTPYETLLPDGARHADPGDDNVWLGDNIDYEPDGQPPDRDDVLGDTPDDEDGVDLVGSGRPGGPYTTPYVAAQQGGVYIYLNWSYPDQGTYYIDGWIDWNQDGDWYDRAEHIINMMYRAGNSKPIATFQTFSIPKNAEPGTTWARFRIYSTDLDSPTGNAPDGEVEDHQIEVVRMDFGDAPHPPYPTRLNNGARHIIIPDLLLGAIVDNERNGKQNADATGDDNSNFDDEDGVEFPTALVIGQQATVQVIVNKPVGIPTGRLDAWIDFNGDGDWYDPAEQIIISQPLPSTGTYDFDFDVPVSATPGLTFARFRLSIEGQLGPTGLADTGEVEDYQVRIVRPAEEEEKPEPWGATVGGDVFPVNKVSLIAPWIAIGIIILAGGLFLIRRRAHSYK